MSLWKVWRQRPTITTKDQYLDDTEPKLGNPRVIVSLDRSWINMVGMAWFTYFRLIRRAGGVPQRIDYGHGPEPENIHDLAEDIMLCGDALLLSGGEDVDAQLYDGKEPARHPNPRRDRFEIAMIQIAMRDDKPIMGICRGCQLLNVAAGGTLQTIRTDPQFYCYHCRFRTHPILVEPTSHVAAFIEGNRLEYVRSFHGQAVKETGANMKIAATAPDGIPEAIECDCREERWIVGVQWHPELMPFKNQEHKIVDHFVSAARKRM